jgi:CBS domain-containing membrane protein
MSRQPFTVPPEATLREAWTLMAEHGIATCPVVSATGELQGMLSRVDLLRAFRPSRELPALRSAEAGPLRVREIMRCGVVTVTPEDPLVDAVDRFIETRLHALPVVRSGPGRPVVVGIVTQGDVLAHLMRGALPGG